MFEFPFKGSSSGSWTGAPYWKEDLDSSAWAVVCVPRGGFAKAILSKLPVRLELHAAM